jgi:hypothetical protein
VTRHRLLGPQQQSSPLQQSPPGTQVSLTLASLHR